MNAQQVFEKVARHLFKQGKAATIDDGSCCYRGNYKANDPIRCAVGVLIPDEVYTSEMEGETVESLCLDGPYMERYKQLVPVINDVLAPNLELLTELQTLHDADLKVDDYFSRVAQNNPVFDKELLRKNLRKIAKFYDLDSKFLDEL